MAATSFDALLRETALLVSVLSQGAKSTSVAQLRQRCSKLVSDYEQALVARGTDDDSLLDAVYMQCGLLDETVLSHLSAAMRVEWEALPLQVERFSRYNAGEYVFERLAVRMRESPPNVPLLICYARVLGLGFKGRFAREGEAQRMEIVHALHNLLAQHSAGNDENLVVDAAQPSRVDWFRYASPWVVAILACAMAMAVFLSVGHRLDQQVSHLLAVGM